MYQGLWADKSFQTASLLGGYSVLKRVLRLYLVFGINIVADLARAICHLPGGVFITGLEVSC